MNKFSHPLPLGTKIKSLRGETDYDDDIDRRRETGENAIGKVTNARQTVKQGWLYCVEFQASGVFVFLDERSDLFTGTTAYELVP